MTPTPAPPPPLRHPPQLVALPPEVQGFERVGDVLARILPAILTCAPLRDLPALAAVSGAGLAFLSLIIGAR